jgi:hypothetical protein
MMAHNARLVALVGLAAAVACGGGGDRSPAHDQPPAAQQTHDHAAPHGGTVVELGQEAAHIELVVDTAAGKLTAYVLDGEAEVGVRIAAPAIELRIEPRTSTGSARASARITVRLDAVANALTGESVGATSEFSGRHEAFRTLRQFRGVIPEISVRGLTYRDVAFDFPGG